jgi:hypothetical protein
MIDKEIIELANKLKESKSQVATFIQIDTGQKFILITKQQFELLTGGKIDDRRPTTKMGKETIYYV